jgi:hypothetical protein
MKPVFLYQKVPRLVSTKLLIKNSVRLIIQENIYIHEHSYSLTANEKYWKYALQCGMHILFKCIVCNFVSLSPPSLALYHCTSLNTLNINKKMFKTATTDYNFTHTHTTLTHTHTHTHTHTDIYFMS